MKTYFRLLSFAKPIEKYAIPYVIFTLLYVVFSTTVFTLLTPLMNTLFSADSNATHVVHAIPKSTLDVTGWFNYYMDYFIRTHGAWGALQFVCMTLIVTVLLGNFFRYLSARTMENLRVHTLIKPASYEFLIM
jgi:subfamily B ATP-binding cassette protein MsbA